MNQQNKVLQNVSARQAIDQTIDRKSFVNTLLNEYVKIVRLRLDVL
jgi:peptide/nickel transport system substrate-binding protein